MTLPLPDFQALGQREDRFLLLQALHPSALVNEHRCMCLSILSDFHWEVQAGNQLLQQFNSIPAFSSLGGIGSALVRLYLLFLSLALWGVSGLTALNFIGLQT